MTEMKQGRCHSGVVDFRVVIENGLENIRRCNYSLCSRKGAFMASVPLSGLDVVRGEDSFSRYQWNTGVAKHYFCKTCGIYMHHQRRSNPEEFGFNVACIDNVDIESFVDFPMGNGRVTSRSNSEEP
ncbi:MAG: GFA family protein [bacterium]